MLTNKPDEWSAADIPRTVDAVLSGSLFEVLKGFNTLCRWIEFWQGVAPMDGRNIFHQGRGGFLMFRFQKAHTGGLGVSLHLAMMPVIPAELASPWVHTLGWNP